MDEKFRKKAEKRDTEGEEHTLKSILKLWGEKGAGLVTL